MSLYVELPSLCFCSLLHSLRSIQFRWLHLLPLLLLLLWMQSIWWLKRKAVVFHILSELRLRRYHISLPLSVYSVCSVSFLCARAHFSQLSTVRLLFAVRPLRIHRYPLHNESVCCLLYNNYRFIYVYSVMLVVEERNRDRIQIFELDFFFSFSSAWMCWCVFRISGYAYIKRKSSENYTF